MNILVLTSVYPSPTDSNENVTKVVRYFAQEWVSQGHNVKVIHNSHRYPLVIHCLPKWIKKKIATRISFYISDYRDVKKMHFKDGEIEVWRLPIFKTKPHGDHSVRVLEKQAGKIVSLIDGTGFVPDIIVGHWMSPQAQLLNLLKKTYNCRTSIVLHGRSYIKDSSFNCRQYLDKIDAIGCRSKAEAEFVKNALDMQRQPFVCYSGVPDKFLDEYSFDVKKFIDKPVVWRFIYAGRLVEYKKIDRTIHALSKFNGDFIFDIVGEGSEEQRLKEITNDLRLEEKVIFHGRMDRNDVLKLMRQAHCFVMISSGEVFGLVYLEAMASSCITIGSKNGGIDGVICNDQNGFLCSAGNIDELVEILNKLEKMTSVELAQIAENGYLTAKDYSDSNVAKNYLQEALTWGKE